MEIEGLWEFLTILPLLKTKRATHRVTPTDYYLLLTVFPGRPYCLLITTYFLFWVAPTAYYLLLTVFSGRP
jgi:hypothetical protein